MKSRSLRQKIAVGAAALTLGAVQVVFAQAGAAGAAGGESCLNDIDCKNGPECGGDVCDYNKGPSCVPAGGAAKGMDGWCTKDSDCKCAAQGAKCKNQTYCTFTKASDAPAGGTAGSSGAGGSAGTAGGTPTSGSGGSTSTSSSSDSSSSGGCSISSGVASGSAGLLVGLGALVFGVRRRRRAA